MARSHCAVLEVVDSDVGSSVLLPYLTLPEVSRMECVGRTMKDTLVSGAALCRSARRALLPKLEVVSDGSAAEGERKDWETVVTALRAVPVLPQGPTVRLQGLGRARHLAGAVDRARRRAAEHLAAGGKSAEVVIGRFRFPTTAAVAAPSKSEDAWHISSRVALAVAGPSQPPLELKLGWKDGAMKVGAMVPGTASGDSEDHNAAGYLVDVQAVSDRLLLRLLDSHVSRHQGWVRGTGLCSRLGSSSALAEELARGLLCVVTVRDASPATLSCARPQKESASRMHAMNFDAPARRV